MVLNMIVYNVCWCVMCHVSLSPLVYTVQVIFLPAPVRSHQNIIIVATITALGHHILTGHGDPPWLPGLHTILWLHNTHHTGITLTHLQPPHTLYIRRIVCRVVWGPDISYSSLYNILYNFLLLLCEYIKAC